MNCCRGEGDQPNQPNSLRLVPSSSVLNQSVFQATASAILSLPWHIIEFQALSRYDNARPIRPAPSLQNRRFSNPGLSCGDSPCHPSHYCCHADHVHSIDILKGPQLSSLLYSHSDRICELRSTRLVRDECQHQLLDSIDVNQWAGSIALFLAMTFAKFVGYLHPRHPRKVIVDLNSEEEVTDE
jgi:hypothetical protein